MFTDGLDVSSPDAVIENLHLPNYPSAAENAPALRNYLDSEVTSGHLLRTKVGSGPTPARVVPIAFIPKPGQPGKFRLISDASAPLGHSPNSFSPLAPHFKMTTIADVFARADCHTWSSVTDIEAAFRALPLNPAHSGLLAIEFEGFYYWELRAPFGWTLAPFSWCRLSSIIQRYCALHGHNIVVYVDDFLGLGQSEAASNTSQDFLIALLLVLGLSEKRSKRARASQVVKFIGFTLDFPNLSVSIDKERSSQLVAEINLVLSRPRVSVASLRSLTGKLSFASQVVLGGRTFTRRLFDACSNSTRFIPIDLAIRADLQWWIRFILYFNGRSVVHWSSFRPVAYCTTDASDIAACGVGPYPSAWVHGWTHNQNWHINIRELWSVYHSLVTWGPSWANHDVAFAIDNFATVSWINYGVARSPQAMKILRKIFWLTAKFNLRIRATWIPSEENVAADAGSRFAIAHLAFLINAPVDTIILSGSPPPSPFPLPLVRSTPADHLQTLLKLKTPWLSWQSRVYSPRWPTLHSSPTEAHGSPSFGFSWPSSGLPSRRSKSFLFVTPPGSGTVVTPTPPSELTSLLSRHSTSQWGTKSPWVSPPSRPWRDAYKEFDATCALLKASPTSPSSYSSPSVLTSTTKAPKISPSGPPSVLVSSPSYDPEIWFRNLKALGNPAPTSHVATSVLLSGVQSFASVLPKRVSSMVLQSKSPSPTSLAPSFAPFPPSAASLSSLLPNSPLPSSLTPKKRGSRTRNYSRSSKPSHRNAASTPKNLVATAAAAVAQRSRPPLAGLTTTSSSKDCGSRMPSCATFTSPSIKGGISLRSWPVPLSTR